MDIRIHVRNFSAGCGAGSVLAGSAMVAIQNDLDRALIAFIGGIAWFVCAAYFHWCILSDEQIP